MIHYLFESSLCSITFLAFYYLALRGRSFHHWNRFYLLTTLVVSMVIPIIHIPIEEIIYVQPRSISSTNYMLHDTVSSGFWQIVPVIVYSTGVLISINFFCRELFQIRKIISHAQLSHFKQYSIAQINQDIPLCSFFKYIITNKDISISSYELDHELSHIQQKHSYDKLFMEIIKSFFWFNPAMYIYRNNLYTIHEYLADQSVVSKSNADSYKDYLFNALKSQHQYLFTVNPFQSLIKKRIYMLNNKKESTKHIFLFVFPMLVCLTICISCEKTTKLVPVSGDDYSHLQFNENGEVIINDTIHIIDEDTQKEKVRILTGTMDLDTYKRWENAPVGFIKVKDDDTGVHYEYVDPDSEDFKQVYQERKKHTKLVNSNSDLITVNDTIITFNEDTYEEEVKIVSRDLTQEEHSAFLKERAELASLNLDNFMSQQKEKNYSTLDDNRTKSNSIVNYIEVSDTVIVFNADTYEEEVKIVKTKMTKEEYEAHLKEMERLAKKWEPFRKAKEE